LAFLLTGGDATTGDTGVASGVFGLGVVDGAAGSSTFDRSAGRVGNTPATETGAAAFERARTLDVRRCSSTGTLFGTTALGGGATATGGGITGGGGGGDGSIAGAAATAASGGGVTATG
jgi:hypothetical protein